MFKQFKFVSIFVALIVLIIAPSRAQAIDLAACFNMDDDVSFFFTSCIRSNFSDLAEHYGMSLEKCYNFPDHVTDAWVDCINGNFSRLATASGRQLQHCENPGWTLTFSSFPSCVRSNFSRLE